MVIQGRIRMRLLEIYPTYTDPRAVYRRVPGAQSPRGDSERIGQLEERIECADSPPAVATDRLPQP